MAGEVDPTAAGARSLKAGVWLLPVLIFLLALGLRVLRLDFQPLWWDEGYSVWFAAQPVEQMLALTAADIHPPLYYALLHGWIALFGAGPVSLRFLSVLCGLLALPAIYLAGRLMLGRRAALLAAFLLAVNPLHIFYSQEVRMYGLVALLSAGVVTAAWKTLAAPRATAARPIAPLAAYVVLTTAALYTQYYAAFLPIGLSMYALWHWRHDFRALARWLAAQGLVVLLYTPWLLYAAPKLVPYVSQKVVQDADRPLGPVLYLARHLSAFLVGHLEGRLAPFWPVALLLLFVPLSAGWGLLLRNRPASDSVSSLSTPRSARLMLAFVVLANLILGYFISLRYPFFPPRGERLLLLALPPFMLLTAAALDALWAQRVALGWAVVALIGAASAASLVGFYATPRYAGDDYRPLIARTVEQGLPEDTVLAVYPWQVGYWRSYGSPNGPVAMLLGEQAWGPTAAAAVDGVLARGRVWFPAHLALGAILESQIEAHLAERAVPFANAWYGPGTRLSAWAVADDAMVRADPVAPGLRFRLPQGGAIELRTASGPQAAVPAANAVALLRLGWHADELPPPLGVSVRLVDAIGQIWAQHDYEPLGAVAPVGTRGSASPTGAGATGWQAEDRLGLLIPAGTPPGRYAVEVTLYTADGGRPLEVQDIGGRPLGQSGRLFDLTVVPADRTLGAERLPIGTARRVEFADGLRLLGYSTDARPVAPGETRLVNLFWQASAVPATDYIAFVQMLDRQGRVVSGWEAPPGGPHPTGAWTPGTLMRTQATLRPSADLPDGHYAVIAGLFRADDKARLRAANGADHVILGHLVVRGRPHEMRPPQPAYSADVRFEPAAQLVGYDLTQPPGGLQPGGSLALTLYWQALAATERPHTVFVHLLDGAGTIWGYGDSEPGEGRYPTTGWLAGEYLADRHLVQVDGTAPAGVYRLAIGLYDPRTGQRLLTAEGRDHLLLDMAVDVVAP